MVIGWWVILGLPLVVSASCLGEPEYSPGLREEARIVRDDVWLPLGGDVHLRIWLGAMVFDYVATAVAARNLIRDWKRKPWCTIELMRETVAECPFPLRLPCERLFLGP